MELKQYQKMSLQLVMTPQLQQAIKLLQLSRLELSETVQNELLENPVLEIEAGRHPVQNRDERFTVRFTRSQKTQHDSLILAEVSARSGPGWRPRRIWLASNTGGLAGIERSAAILQTT